MVSSLAEARARRRPGQRNCEADDCEMPARFGVIMSCTGPHGTATGVLCGDHADQVLAGGQEHCTGTLSIVAKWELEA